MDNSESNNILYNKNLSYEEIWDDTILIQQYDALLGKAKKKMQKKLSSSTISTEGEEAIEITNDKNSTLVNKKKIKSRKRNEWHTGDPCRGIYEDQYYEATIISINPKKGICTVSFVGYNNEADLPIRTLVKSYGFEARRQQEKEANGVELMSEVSESSYTESDQQSEISNNFKAPLPPQKSPSNFYHPNPLPDLPPPPLMHFDSEMDRVTSEALHTMLMSWYMTGYHTGYYQALKNTQNKRK